MKYVALLRGVNVGGKNAIRMAALKACLEAQGFERVATYIQSGNVIFETPERSAGALTRRIEQALDETFGFPVRIVLQTRGQMSVVVRDAPAGWLHRTDLRRNVAFLKPPLTAAQAIRDVETTDGVDVVSAGKGVLYMSTTMSALTRSRLNKIATKQIYKSMTLRTFGVCQKILALMEERFGNSQIRARKSQLER